MRNILKTILIAISLVFPLGVFGQQQSEYNRKGDEAVARKDFSDAKMWYEEGVSQCDSYSIKRLTEIWLSNEEMRLSMRSLMNKCLNCLNVKATENDVDAISQLILYYQKGIGTPENDELALYWQNYKENLSRPQEPPTVAPDTILVMPEKRERMKFLVAYTYSIEAPFGVRVGGVGKRLGWYVQVKSNISFQNSTANCDSKGEILSFADNQSSYQANGKNKTNTLSGTVGMIIKCTSWLHASVGLGYGHRNLLHQFTTYSYDDMRDQQLIWCKNTDASYKGIAAEADVLFNVAGPLFVGVGVNTINFKYVDLNASIGVFF